MPINTSTGVYSAPSNSWNPAVADTVINSDDWNAIRNDMADAMSRVPATTRALWATAAQVQDGALVWGGTASGSANALAVALSPPITAYVAGLEISFITGAAANTGAATLAVNGLSALAINGGDSRLDNAFPSYTYAAPLFHHVDDLLQDFSSNANEIVCEMAHEVLPVVKHTPVLAGVNGTDPFMIPDEFLHRLIGLGFSGVQNFPTVGLIDGTFRANLEETGMGYGLEVEMIRRARALDLLTTPYVFSAAETRAMTEAGADIVVCHMGLTTGGSIGAETALTLADCVAPINAWAAVAKAVNPDVIVLCHGGPIATPDDAQFILANCPACDGFYGASSMERLPTELALTETTRRFTQITRQQETR